MGYRKSFPKDVIEFGYQPWEYEEYVCSEARKISRWPDQSHEYIYKRANPFDVAPGELKYIYSLEDMPPWAQTFREKWLIISNKDSMYRSFPIDPSLYRDNAIATLHSKESGVEKSFPDITINDFYNSKPGWNHTLVIERELLFPFQGKEGLNNFPVFIERLVALNSNPDDITNVSECIVYLARVRGLLPFECEFRDTSISILMFGVHDYHHEDSGLNQLWSNEHIFATEDGGLSSLLDYSLPIYKHGSIMRESVMRSV